MKSMVKEILCRSLIELCETHDLTKITVTQLVDHAQMSRQTFYNHFQDINELIAYIPIQTISEGDAPLFCEENIRRAYQFSLDHEAFFKQLPFHEGQNNFRETYQDWAKETYYEKFITPLLDSRERESRMIAIDLYCIGATGIFLEWCKQDLSWNIDNLIKAHEEILPAFMK